MQHEVSESQRAGLIVVQREMGSHPVTNALLVAVIDEKKTVVSCPAQKFGAECLQVHLGGFPNVPSLQRQRGRALQCTEFIQGEVAQEPVPPRSIGPPANLRLP
jgi:hypothetical protein